MLSIFLVLITIFCIHALYFLFYRSSFTKNPFRYSKLNVESYKDCSYLIQNKLPCHTHLTHSDHFEIELKENWSFYREKSSEKAIVSVPHCFNTAESPLRDFEGTCIYEKSIEISDDDCQRLLDKNKKVHLVFKGSFYKTEVYLNNSLIGINEGGYLPFRFDITSYISKNSKLTLLVKVNNLVDKTSIPPLLYPDHPLGFHPYGGLHKSVIIEAMPEIFVFKTHVTPYISKEKGIADVVMMFWNTAKTESKMSIKLMVKIKNSSGTIIHNSNETILFEGNGTPGICKLNLNIENPLVWSPQTPNLYELIMESPYELWSVKFGFKTLVVKNNKLLLNRKPVELLGACRHEEDVDNGLAQSHKNMEKDIEAAKEAGMNYLRLSHYPHEPYFLDRCDEEGFLVWEEIPLYQAGLAPIKYIAAKRKDHRDSFLKKLIRLPVMIYRTRQFTDPGLLSKAHDELLMMIERDYNHPSIGIWGIGNECWTLNPAGAKALNALKMLVKQHDPQRIGGYAAMTIPGLTKWFERSFKVMDIIGINEYFGWYYGDIEDVSEFLDSIIKKYPGKPFIITETGADCAYGVRSRNNRLKDISEDYQAYYIRRQMEIIRSKPSFSGVSVWVLKDFLCPEYGSENSIPFYNLKGLVDRSHKRKLSFEELKKAYAKRSPINEER